MFENKVGGSAFQVINLVVVVMALLLLQIVQNIIPNAFFYQKRCAMALSY